MLERAVEIIVEKLFQPRTRKEKDEDTAKQRLVFFYLALRDYHAAYTTHSTDNNELNYDEWVGAAEHLVHISDGIASTLAIYAPQLIQSIQSYLDQTTPSLTRAPTTSDELCTCEADFLHAINELGRFIKERMTIGEILKAYEAYCKQRFW